MFPATALRQAVLTSLFQAELRDMLFYGVMVKQSKTQSILPQVFILLLFQMSICAPPQQALQSLNQHRLLPQLPLKEMVFFLTRLILLFQADVRLIHTSGIQAACSNRV